jgi:hypothetical protein
MITETPLDSLLQTWPFFVATCLGAFLSQIFGSRRIDVPSIRTLLGCALDRFSAIPHDRLDPIIASAAAAVERGWRGIVSTLCSALWFGSAISLPITFLAMFPSQPHRGWFALGVVCVVAFLGSMLQRRLDRAFVLSELERRCNGTAHA